MTNPRDCRCETLRGTGEWSVRRLPEPSVSYEAVCDSCEMTYWLSADEAAKSLPADIVSAGRRALDELTARTANPQAAREREARAKFSALRPVRDAVVLFARRVLRLFSRR
ncbi:MAG: hypothetical protein ACKVU1_11230 [bacterium]